MHERKPALRLGTHEKVSSSWRLHMCSPLQVVVGETCKEKYDWAFEALQQAKEAIEASKHLQVMMWRQVRCASALPIGRMIISQTCLETQKNS
eukprot:36862-Amphidinium_carterae.1